MQSLDEDIKKLFDNEFKFLNSRCEDLIVKSDPTLNSRIKHLQEELILKDEIINQTLALLSNITNTKLQSKNDIATKLIDDSIVSNRNSRKSDINILEHDKKNNNNKKKNEWTNNAIKDHVKNAKIDYEIKSNFENIYKMQLKKTRIEVVGDSMVNGIKERERDEQNKSV